MTDVTLCGTAFSTYVRSARMALEEKGVSYALTNPPLKDVLSGGLAGDHPFARMPALRHGEVHVFETLAVLSYIDDAFDGPRLFPTQALERARTLQWISVFNDYVVPDLLRHYMVPMAFAPETLDRDALPATLARIEKALDVLADAYDDRPWLVGEAPTAADLFVVPALAYLPAFPDTAPMLDRRPALSRALAAMAERPSYTATLPPARSDAPAE